MNYYIVIEGDCNDWDTLTKMTPVKWDLNELIEFKNILSKITNINRDDLIKDRDCYNEEKIDLFFSNDELKKLKKIEKYIDWLLPKEWQSWQVCHTIESVKLLQEI